jgi:NAD(P)-dependent dehydrogenase (short-subunit alcohol dehydrogenase family)
LSGKGEALAKELGGVGVTGSNQSNEDLQRLVDQTIEKWGHIDVLVKSAERGLKVPLLELSNKDWQQGMDVYFLNVVLPDWSRPLCRSKIWHDHQYFELCCL